MSHSVSLTIIANQQIKLLGIDVNIHMLTSLVLDSHGNVKSFYIKDSREPNGFICIEKGMKYFPQDINDYESINK